MTRLFFAACLLGLPGLAAAAPGCPAPAGGGARLAFAAAEHGPTHFADVIAGGRLDLARCPATGGQGRVTPDPDFTVEIAADRPGAVEFRTAGACDTVLLVADAAGAWRFDDDGAGGRDARVRLEAAVPGSYHVWIGTYDAASCRARLIVEAGE